MVTNPIRIVPLHVAPAAPPAAPANLTYRGGPLLSAVEVLTAFWGADWLATEAPLLTQINDFFLNILSSALTHQLSEYSVPDAAIGHGSVSGTAVITDSEPPATVTVAQIQR